MNEQDFLIELEDVASQAVAMWRASSSDDETRAGMPATLVAVVEEGKTVKHMIYVLPEFGRSFEINKQLLVSLGGELGGDNVHPISIFLISEVWMAETSIKDKEEFDSKMQIYGRLSQFPREERKECLSIFGQTADGKQAFRMFEIKRSHGGESEVMETDEVEDATSFSAPMMSGFFLANKTNLN